MPNLRVEPRGDVFDVPAGESLLDFCQANGVPIDFGCTVGSCGTCRVEVLSGMENLNPPSEDERETIEMCTDVENVRLTCQCSMTGDVTVRPAD
ncbi:MAG: 2Fe-2S iron-sulfur cluster-binding protein [Planctomycetota bacterium]